jgi:hypothetical protein
VPFARQHRRVGIGPVATELVSDLGQPPIHQLVGTIDRRNLATFRTATPAALAVSNVECRTPPGLVANRECPASPSG